LEVIVFPGILRAFREKKEKKKKVVKRTLDICIREAKLLSILLPQEKNRIRWEMKLCTKSLSRQRSQKTNDCLRRGDENK